MSEWQPIETAPKTDVLLVCCADGTLHIAYWGNDAWEACDAYDMAFCDVPPSTVNPTHWMPLPDPPTATPA